MGVVLHNWDELTLELCYTQGFWYARCERGASGCGCGWGVDTAAMLHNKDNLTLELCYTQGFGTRVGRGSQLLFITRA